MTDPILPLNPLPIQNTPPAGQMIGQATGNLDTLLENAKNVEKTSVWGYLIWGLTMPPITTILALVIALRRGLFFLVLPSITIAFSLLAIIPPVLIFFLFGPIHIVTTQFTFSQNIYSDPKLTLTSILLTFLAIAGVVFGFYFKKRTKQVLTLGPLAVAILILILTLEHVIVWMNLTSAVQVISKQAQIILNQQGVPF